MTKINRQHCKMLLFVYFFQKLEFHISFQCFIRQWKKLTYLETQLRTIHYAMSPHYENTPIQIYRKFHVQKTEKFQIKNSDSFHISAQNIDCGYSLEPPGSNEYPQSMFSSKNKKNNVYLCKPQFYYIKVGFMGVKII